MKVSEILEMGWTKGADARNSNYKPVSPYSSEATFWCLMGAIKRVCMDMDYDECRAIMYPLYDYVLETSFGIRLGLRHWIIPSISEISTVLNSWNDNLDTTLEDVLAAVRKVESMKE